MATEITMPQLSDTMDEGTILSWLKKEGDTVSRGDALAEVATDKADLEIESFYEGTLLKIHSPEGTTVKVGSVIAHVGEAGESVPSESSDAASSETETSGADSSDEPSQDSAATDDSQQQSSQPQAQAQDASSQQEATQSSATPTESAPVDDGANGGQARVKISPLAKNLAQAHGVSYQSIQGSGDGGRIVKRDIEEQVGRNFSPQEIEQVVQTGQAGAAASAAPQSPAQSAKPSTPAQPQRPQQSPAATPSAGASTEVLSKMRQTIAQRMVESVTTAPHFYVSTKVHADAMIALRTSLKTLPQYEGITFNHLVLRASGLALAKFPRINSSYREGSVVQPAAVNIGIITALPDGLLIPVVKSADSLTLADIVQESNSLVQRARSGRPKSEDLQGGTFCISNIGKADVESFTAIINPGQGAILAVSSMQEEPVVQDGAIVVGTTMRLTLSVDHRIIDGVLGGQFVTELKRLLETPALLLA